MRQQIPVNTPVVHVPTGKRLAILQDDGEKSYVLCVVGGEGLSLGHAATARMLNPGERISLRVQDLVRICEKDCRSSDGTRRA